MNVSTASDVNKRLSVDNLLFLGTAATFFSLPLGTSLPTIFAVLTTALCLFSGRFHPVLPDLFRSRRFWPVFGMMLLPWIGLTYTPDPAEMGMDYADKTHYWIYGLSLAAVIRRMDMEFVIRAFLAGLAFNALVGTLQLAGIFPPNHGWYSGIGRGYSTLTAYLVVGILAASHDFRKTEALKARLLPAFLMLLFFFHLVILKGRTGYLTFIFLSPLVIRNFFRTAGIWKIGLICLILPSLMWLSPVVRSRAALSVAQLQYHLNADPEEAWGRVYTRNQDRFYMWYGAAQMIREHPFFGVGTGGYQMELKKRGSPEDPDIAHPHNDLLYMAVSFGIFGVAVFFWLFAVLLKTGWRHREETAGYFILSVSLVILISGLFNGQTIDSGTLFLLSLTAAFMHLYPLRDENEKPESENRLREIKGNRERVPASEEGK